ncbi:MAG: TVP38/TMEM64 family protein [Proteobacteria bacterium]|nr:TVP38/TMEM64 family protein [Pseudomonadota bacterium]MBU1452420.1 TVP38/TMEM64 family protein [Pseudomonadota bacterium]MBU2467687.1 TVP38/TMEM64 family protein [Pseudomonadota bacterium]MBU2518239.1 TVP38/TMEM64 family protein [Pseudomonadota bacterium]
MKQRLIKRLAVVGIVIAAILAFWLLDLGQYFSLSYVKASQARFQAYYAAHPAFMLGGYFVVYVLVTAFSLPGAAVMTLMGGALFGFWWTLLVVSFASSAGATLACFFARFVLGNWVQQKFADKLGTINRGVEREGAFYLFTLRLVPLFPFFVINLVMGLTKMPLRTFYWVSQVGMLPGTAVFTNAGKELGQISSLGGILSPGLIISFVILGIFPLVVKKILAWYRSRTGRQAIIKP